MDCLSWNSCQCTLGTQIKTQLIIYQTGNISNRQSASFREKDFKIKRTSQQYNKMAPRQSQSIKMTKHEAKADETIDTPNKMVSMSSCQILRKSKQSVKAVKEFPGKFRQDQQLEINIQQCDKQNIDQNSIQSRISSELQSPKVSIISQGRTRISSIGLNKLKSTRLTQAFSGSLGLQSPHSSNISEKNIATILLEKQNCQLRGQLSKLKLQQKQLLQEQQKLKQKSNRQIGHLKKRSQELERRSYQRKKQMNELKQMLKIAQKTKKNKENYKQ